MRRAIVFVVLVVVPSVFWPGLLATAAADAVLQPPVPGPIVEPFRAPLSAYGSGHRGVEYRPPSGTEVRASAAGTVQFAGPVAHELWVTIVHPDSLRTSYGPLSSVAVAPGQVVGVGEPLGTSTDHLHFGVRNRNVYVDPEPLLPQPPIAATVRARLVPTREEAGFGRRDGGLLHQALGWLRHAFNFVTGGGGPCTKFDAPLPPPPAEHVVILVAGYGSNSRSLTGIEHLDVVGAGFEPSSVLRFSYAGGRIPDPSDAAEFAAITATDYDSAASQQPIEESARALADLIGQVRAVANGRPIDLVAHSQGGLVAVTSLHYLADHEGLRVVTIGSPHDGDTLAGTLGRVAKSSPAAEGLLDTLEATGATQGMEHDSPSPQEMAPDSAFMDRYRSTGVASDVPITSIGGRYDPIVTAPDTRLPGAHNIVVASATNPLTAHDGLPGRPEVTREVTLAARGLPPSCEGLDNRVGDALIGNSIRAVESLPVGL
ncbi:MAG: peptidoglycan DD-metalloendopeptidase family protein [Acidimicrobiales bacterium]